MNTKNILLILILLTSFLISCNKDDDDDNDNKDDLSNLINSVVHFEEPPHYDPEQVGEPVISDETINGVTYKKTETKYKYAQKFENKTQASFSNKKNIRSDNDIFLGGIIQGKHWKETGDLISIGNFERKNLTITISGIDINGSNSVESYPSKSNMTDAINNLTSSNDFSPNTNNYNFVNEIAHNKQQIGLSLGLHPSWLENLGIDFSIENTYETNTVYIYFKQKYYTISTELPAQPSDFFNDNVNLDALKTKISAENPAGYISSIDYGRVIIVKMTSSQNKTDMKLAIGAVFNGLNIGVSAEHQDIINNSTFTSHVFGGSSSTLINSIEETINFIKNGLEITNLQNAVPIDYHVHYLDGSPFNTGSEIEYTETEYEITSASTMKIKKVTFTQLPVVQADGDDWDIFTDYADVYLNISKLNGTSWQNIASYNEQYFEETSSTMIDNEEIFWNTNFEISDFDMTYSLLAYDYDSSSDDEFMGEVQFTVNNDIINDGNYPTTKTLYNSETDVRIKLEIEWTQK